MNKTQLKYEVVYLGQDAEGVTTFAVQRRGDEQLIATLQFVPEVHVFEGHVTCLCNMASFVPPEDGIDAAERDELCAMACKLPPAVHMAYFYERLHANATPAERAAMKNSAEQPLQFIQLQRVEDDQLPN